MNRLGSVAIACRQLRRVTGAVCQVREHIRLFSRLASQVDVYCESVDRRAVKEGGGIPRAISGWPLSGHRRRRFFNWRVLRQVRRRNYALVVGHGDIMEQDVLCLHNCVHLAHEMIHGCPAPANHVMARIHGELLSGGYFRLLIANSNMMRQDIVGRFRIEPERVEVVYPGYDPAKFNRDERDALRPWVRKQLKLGAKDVLIGLVTSGNFEKRNVDFFLRSVAKLPGELKPRCHFLVTGRESKVAHYKSLAKEVGLGRRVHFSDFTSRVQDSYHALDVCVLPAKLEEFGRVVLEAMACGLPVITSDRVGCSELFPSGSRALVFPSGDEDEFLRRLSALISHPDLRHKLGDGNLAVARNNREPEQGRRFESILRERGLI